MANPSPWPSAGANDSGPDGLPANLPQPAALALLDFLFPGFSMLASAIQKYLHIDLTLYIPLLLLSGVLTVVWNYASSYLWDQLETHFMSVVDIRTDDEIYNIIMAWVARQKFSQTARRFVVNTNLNSRSWYLRWDEDEEESESRASGERDRKKRDLAFTPSFGTHYFWYRGRLLVFRRTSNREQSSHMPVSEREEISVSSFGRNPWILKELLREARQIYAQKDEHKTLIYRGSLKLGSGEPAWQRCMARSNRPFSTVILNEKTKQDLIDDITDYLDPATQRWYANRGIPYRRGYLLHGPPGTGKSSLSLALAGFFKMRIYIVSLSSVIANEESLGSLFSELPRRCVVLLEDIDTAGLTHTRDESQPGPQNQIDNSDSDNEPSGKKTASDSNNESNTKNTRLSLSGLLNILDGVASQEGRVLIMTTNHIEKLDRALIRPGRVDMVVNFGLADTAMTSAIFQAIFAQLEGDNDLEATSSPPLESQSKERIEEEKARKREADDARVSALADEFASKIPAHEFSPAEIQGFLMKHKRNAEAAVANAEEFVQQTRKERKDKELREAEEKRKAEEAKKVEEARKVEEAKEAEKAKKEKEEEKKGSEEGKDSKEEAE
ncbi:BCS1 N terminal-domain-containing protein [Durotheca rogersii]|uniref:BCS1 N terminal-domain-containing protein n=1 Tax=Durotheca rogersii TaxID=419775 RepID=UPI00221F6493|nr:BCS1 N terminal-domain-containing protein [Durotheca rogersii]KAI5866227.1 BCS1 N terminal-domain-containing protein [Durotheca rogersii]